jgi:hypothetical protein
VPLLIAILIVVGYILVLILEGSPRVKVIPIVVKCLDILFRCLLVAEPRYRLLISKASLAVKELVPLLVEGFRVFAAQFACGWLDIGSGVDAIPLAPLNGIEKDFGSFLDALEEGVVVGLA